MYKEHKRLCGIIFISIFLFTCYMKLDFKDIASECISIISIALAVYAICISSLISSPLLEKLKKTVDDKLPQKTQLGIIKKYIQNAMMISIITIIFSCIIKITSYNINNTMFENQVMQEWIYKINMYQIFSSTCFGLFSLNFTFIWLIFIFIINRQVDK